MAIQSTTHRWDAESYHNNSSAQQEAAISLFNSISVTGNEEVLDVGCGDGKITQYIATQVPHGNVLGTDISPEMVAFATARFAEISNLQFSQQAAQSLTTNRKFDLIFSSFALQWVEHIEQFFDKAQEILNPSGKLVATIPLGVSDKLEESIKQTISAPKWAPYFENFSSGWHFQKADKYKQCLKDYSFEEIDFQEVSQEKKFSSREKLEQYVHQWLSHLNPLPEELKSEFFHELMDLYFTQEPIDTDGSAYLRFQRVDFIAQKYLRR